MAILLSYEIETLRNGVNPLLSQVEVVKMGGAGHQRTPHSLHGGNALSHFFVVTNHQIANLQ